MLLPVDALLIDRKAAGVMTGSLSTKTSETDLRSRYGSLVAIVFLWSVLVGQGSSALAQDNLVEVEKGELPIILSAPHGGNAAIPGAIVRQGDGGGSFSRKRDLGTAELTKQLADAIEQELGKRPYTVIAKFHRKYVDANRPEKRAYESKNAELAYDAYHRAIAQAHAEVAERWGRGVLFDIHGQAREPMGIFRGTQNGKTATYLVRRFGRDAIVGANSVFGQLAADGVKVLPAIDSKELEHPSYDGGYIVMKYGSAVSGTIDGIQLELGRELRGASAREVTAEKLASAIAAFAREYLFQ